MATAEEALEKVGTLVKGLEEEKASLAANLEDAIKREAATQERVGALKTAHVQLGDALCREKKLQSTIAALRARKDVQAAESQQEK